MAINETDIRYCLTGCRPAQVISFSYALDDMADLCVTDTDGNRYDMKTLKYSYSQDGACWSCYADYDTALAATEAWDGDFNIRVKVYGSVGHVTDRRGAEVDGWSVSLWQGFDFTSFGLPASSNVYNPYANLECAVALQRQLAESVAAIAGIPIYYFRLKPDMGSRDLTFKEYTLMGVEAVKQIKMVIQGGQMPSSKPDFGDFGLGFQTDWETEITKGQFATAFGETAQPMEGDMVWVPMMKRMWTVTGAYEEKKDAFMWNAATFKVVLNKYQEKGSVDLGSVEDQVNSLVKNKYEDLFGTPEKAGDGSGTASTDSPAYAASSLYPVYESDATRGYVACAGIDFMPQNTTYMRGTMVSDNSYMFSYPSKDTVIVYQRRFCGGTGSMTCILHPDICTEYTCELFRAGNVCLTMTQKNGSFTLTPTQDGELTVTAASGSTYFLVFRWSEKMNTADLTLYPYTYNHDIPQYKLAPQHYLFDMDTPAAQSVRPWNIEYMQPEPACVSVTGFWGWLTNVKVMDVYDPELTELLQMYPQNSHLIINDTARRLLDLPGVAMK